MDSITRSDQALFLGAELVLVSMPTPAFPQHPRALGDGVLGLFYAVGPGSPYCL